MALRLVCACVLAPVHPTHTSTAAGTGPTLRVCYLQHAVTLGAHYNSVQPGAGGELLLLEEAEANGDAAAAADGEAAAAADEEEDAC